MHLKISDPVYSSNSYLTLRKAAIAGRGIALLPIRLVGDELADGTLVNVRARSRRSRTGRCTRCTPPAPRRPRQVRVFLDFVSDWFRKQPGQRPTGPSRRQSPKALRACNYRLRLLPARPIYASQRASL